MKQTTVVSRYSDCYIEVIHYRSNPTVWIVKRSRTFLFFKRQVLNRWFIDEKQAYAFAESLKAEHERRRMAKPGVLHEQI